MKLQTSRHLRGPNIHGSTSGLLATIVWDSAEKPLLEWKPGAGFAARLGQALTLAPDAALLQAGDRVVAGSPPFFELIFVVFDHLTRDYSLRQAAGRIVSRGEDQVQVFLPCDENRIATSALVFALMAGEAVARSAGPPDLAEKYNQVQAFLRSEGLAAPSMALARAALARDIPVHRLTRQIQVQALGEGAHGRRVINGAADETGVSAALISADDHLTLSVLRRQTLPTPEWDLANTPRQAERLAGTLGYPLTVRPRKGGRRAMILVESEAGLAEALVQAGPIRDGVLMERPLEGLDHSLRVSGGRCLPVGAAAAHPENRILAERAARVIGLGNADVVIRTPDIAASWRETPGVILQVKAPPGALAPPTSLVRESPPATLERLFPGGCNGRIPTVGVTGSLGKSTTCHMVAAILDKAGWVVGRSTTQGAWIGEEKILTGDYAGGGAATSLLLDPTVEAGVFELARGGLARYGMVIDAVDVGAMLNVHDNHLGLDGINTREELAEVKGLVVRHARRLAILNADDPLCLQMRERVTAPRVCLISAAAGNQALCEHQAAGGAAGLLVRSDGDDRLSEIRLFEGEKLIGAMTADEIPASLGGRFEPPLISALYAAAIAQGLGVDFEVTRAALSGFESTQETNPFRMNLFEGFACPLWLTWADGPAPFAALGRFVANTSAEGSKILMFSMMGDRTDAFMEETMAALAAVDAFDQYVVSDWDLLRGREPGEACERLIAWLTSGGVASDRITRAGSYDEACDLTLARGRPGDLVVIITPRIGGERLVRKLEALRGAVAHP